jgi:hypothetical protein
MKSGTTVYYLNKPVVFLAEAKDEVLIELTSGEARFDEYDGPGYTESMETKILVHKKYIKESPVNIDDNFKKSIQEIDNLKKNALNEIERLKRDARSEMNVEKYKIENELKELKHRTSKYNGLSQMLDYLEGKIKYVVYIDSEYSWRFGIDELDKLGEGKETELVSVSFRSKRQIEWRKADFQMYVGNYSDDSGSKYIVEGFETLEAATERFFKVCDEKKSFSISEIEKCDKLGIVHPRVEEAREKCKLAHEENIIKKIAQAKKDLEIAEGLKDIAFTIAGKK